MEDLAGAVTFEDAVHLLWRGRAPSATERERVQSAIGEARAAAFERLGALGDALTMADAGRPAPLPPLTLTPPAI